MIPYSEFAGIVESALAIEVYVAFKQNCAEAQLCRLFKRVIKQDLPVSPALEFRGDADRSHCQDFDVPAVVSIDHGLHEHVLTDQRSVFFHHEIELLHERRGIAQHVDNVVLTAARTVDVPERLPYKVLDLSVFTFVF